MSEGDKTKNLLDKIDQGIARNHGEFLLGLIEIDEDSYCEILNLTRALINKEAFLTSEEENAIISVALVSFAIKEYQNEQFWNEFAIRINLEESDVVKICKESFEAFCKTKCLYFHVGNVNKGYVTSILTHAIIPHSSVHKFLEFLLDLYFNDLEEDYIDNEVEELIQYMHRLFTKYLEDDDISLVVQGSKMTIARQQLPKAFRIAFVKAPSVVTPIIERLLYYMDKSHYGEVIEFLENDRFDEYFAQFNKLSNEITTRIDKRGSKKEHIKRFYTAQYHYENRKLFLQIPRQIIDSNHIENQITLEVYSQDQIISKEELLLTKSKLLFRTEQTSVQIQQFSQQITYRINSDNQTIYDSGELLHREFLIFDLDGNEVNPKNLTDETVKVITRKEKEVLSDDAQIDVVYESNYRISTVFLNEESILLINDKVLSTNVASIRNQLDSKFKYLGVVIRDSSHRAYDVYSRVPEIRIRIPYLKNIDDFILSINNSNYHMNDVVNHEIRLISDGSGDKLGIVHIQNSVLKKLQPSSIIIREKGSNRIYIEEKIFILESLHYEFDKEYYYKDKEAKLLIFTSDDVEINKGLQLPKSINIKKKKAFSSTFYVHELMFEIIIELPILRWEFGGIHSDLKSSNNIWWEDINDYKLFIKYPKEVSKLHIISDSGYERIEGKTINDEIRYSLDHLFQLKDQEPIILGVILNGKEELITELHFNPAIKNFSVAYYEEKHLIQGLYVSWNFLGRGNIYIDVIYSPTQQVIKHYKLYEGNSLMDRDISLYYNYHEIEIYQIIEDVFFGECAKKNVLLRENFIVGDPIIVSCKHKTLKGIKCISESQKFEISNFYLKDIRFSKKNGYYEATGLYLIRDRYTGNKKEWYFINYNPFIIKPVCWGEGRYTFEIVDRDKDGLIYDTRTKYVNPKEGSDKSRYVLIDEVVLEIVG